MVNETGASEISGKENGALMRSIGNRGLRENWYFNTADESGKKDAEC